MAEAASWGTLSIDVPPPFLEPIVDAMVQFLEIFNVIMDIVLVILNIVKVLVVALVSPVLLLIDVIIALLESIVFDLRNAGIYIRGDWDLANGGWKNFLKECRGGYSKFEGRVFEWFTDTSDPGRPDISTASGVFALFFYGSVDVSQVEKLIKMIMSLVKFFKNFDDSQTMLQPAVNLSAKYYAKGLPGLPDLVVEPKEVPNLQEPPIKAKVTWDYASTGEELLNIPFMFPLPFGAIVEVSTVSELWVGFDEPASTATPNKSAKGSGNDPPRFKGWFTSPVSYGGGPLRLFGGTTRISGGPTTQPLNGNNRAAFVSCGPRDQKYISIKEWNATNKKGLQRAFYCKKDIMGTSIILKPDHMPFPLKSVDKDGKPTFESEPATDVFVRVTPLSEEACKDIGDAVEWGETTSDLKDAGLVWELKTGGTVGSRGTYQAECRLGNSAEAGKMAHGTPSEPLSLTMPDNTMTKFTQMIQAAAFICITSRCDIDDDEPYFETETGMLPVANTSYQLLNEKAMDGTYFSNLVNKGTRTFRQRLHGTALTVAERFINRAAGVPTSVMQTLVDNHYEVLCGVGPGDDLTFNYEGGHTFHLKKEAADTIKTDKVTLRDTLIGSSGDIWGVHKNMLAFQKNYSVDGQICLDLLSTMFTGNAWDPAGAAPLKAGVSETETMAYTSPFVLVARSTLSAELREEIFGESGEDVQDWKKFGQAVTAGHIRMVLLRHLYTRKAYTSAALILGIANKVPVSGGKWIALRPFGDILAPVDKALQEALEWLYALRKGLAQVVEMIIKFIEMIEARVREIQALVRKIQALIQMIKDLSISGQLSLLVVNSAGTQGCLNDFMNAENKPPDGSGAVGAGMVALAGGWPLILLELVESIIQADKFAKGDEGAG